MAEPTTPSRADDSVLSALERNIENFPTFSLSGRSGEVIEYEKDGMKWTVRNPPGPLARDAWVGLLSLFNDARRPEDRKIRTTLPELARLIGLSKGGNQWTLLTSAIESLKSVEVTARQAFFRNGKRTTRVIFNLLDRVQITSPAEGDSHETTVIATLSDTVAGSIQDGYYRLMDTEVYFALETPLARSLFSVLDARRYRGASRLPQLTLDLPEVRARLNLQVSAPSHVKRALENAHRELREQGFIREAVFGRTGGPGRGLETYTVTYTFEDAQVALCLGPATPPAESAKGELLKELQLTLRDTHSFGFYAQVVAALSDEQLRGLIAYAREGLAQGTPIEVVRKMFTATAKRRMVDTVRN